MGFPEVENRCGAAAVNRLNWFGINRLRIVLADGIQAPDDWVMVKKTIIRRVSVLGASDTFSRDFDGELELKVTVPGDPSWRDWINCHWEYYLDAHKDNPPRKTTFPERERLFGGKDLVSQGGVGLWSKERLVAFSSLRVGTLSPKIAEVGWTGGCGMQDRVPLHAVLNWILFRAEQLSFTHVEFEADDNDEPLWSWLQLIPSVHDELFITWEMAV